MTTLKKLAIEAYKGKKRLVVPLVGFPGINLTNSNIKLAQQNYDENFKVISALVDKFEPDMIFPLMDLSVEANAIGLNTVFPVDDSATVDHENFDMNSLVRMKQVNIKTDSRALSYADTMKRMKKELPQNVKRGAYVAGPYTLAAHMLGAETAAMTTITDPEKLDTLCEFAKDVIQDYTELMLDAGAEAICFLEPTAAMLGPDEFNRFSSSQVEDLVKYCKSKECTTIYHICGNTNHILQLMADTGVDALSLDSEYAGINLPEVAEILGEDIILIGNINPTGNILTGSPDEVEEETYTLLKNMDKYPNFILSTGCDLPQDVPLENISAFMKAGKEYKVYSVEVY